MHLFITLTDTIHKFVTEYKNNILLIMTKQERYDKVLAYFQEHVPVAETELHYSNPYELIVAVALSAQCTDKRVNMVTPKLFEAFPSAEALAASNSDTVFTYMRSIS